LVQRLDPPGARRGGQADGLGQFHHGYAAVALQCGKYSSVKAINLHVFAPKWLKMSDYH
jgi:hypothetical protein